MQRKISKTGIEVHTFLFHGEMCHETFSKREPFNFPKKNISLDGNLFPVRFVPAVNFTGDNRKMFKRRFVVGKRCGKLKRSMNHTLKTIKRSSIRLLLIVAAIVKFDD